MMSSCARMMFCCVVGLFPMAVFAVAQDEKTIETQILKDWDEFQNYMNQTRKDLSNLQLQYNGSESDETKARIEKAFGEIRAACAKRSKDFWAAIDAFLTKYPKNIAVRQRRLEDKVFDSVSPALKASDARTLYDLTGQGEFLHAAAEMLDKSYDFVKSAACWKAAAEKAETFKVMKSLGDSSMNAFDFATAQNAYRRAAELATAPKEKGDVEMLAAIAGEYIGFWTMEQEYRKRDEAANLPRVEMQTTRGPMVIELFEDDAPNTVKNFVELVEKGFYSNILFHRNIAQFMIQGGDPEGNGRGGPGYNIADEYSLPTARKHFPGSLSMANIGKPNTNGSQFFVTSTTTHWLNDKHTVFGRLIDGHAVPQVQPKDPMNPNKEAAPFRIISAKVLRKRDHPYVAEKL